MAVELPEPAPRARRRGRTALLIATAAVLGVVAGTCTGYLIQADREPTRLPSLSQPTLPQAEGPGPEPLSAAQDRLVKTDGDLRRFLLTKPRGAKDVEVLKGDDGWLGMSAYAEAFTEPGAAFGTLVDEEFRRGAATGWETGSGSVVEIRLLQYRQEETTGAADRTKSQEGFAQDRHGTKGWPIPGTGAGMAYLRAKSDTGYGAEAFAWRGDIAVEIFIDSAEPVSKAQIMDLAQRQLERL
ncbi:hypothetical protein [Streptomyces gibsoniae]|uniref:Lipoprotein n=1 Tax=Streptomyces gibsoniae TaxID=3075529 RepID=A0ABU2TRB5_9ACTN|nr:hypothetical protein [Streptomyces sp. DSM 41699]MDT0463491.1 hypothetical protein [Streptomyces sp. DSM 41699]